MAAQIALFLLSLSSVVHPSALLPVDLDSSSNNVFIVADEFPLLPLLNIVSGTTMSTAQSSRPKRSNTRFSRGGHRFNIFGRWTSNRAPYFLRPGMTLAYVDDEVAAPFRITCLPAVDPDGSRGRLKYSVSPVYPMDQQSFDVGRTSGCVYVVQKLDRWPNLHPLNVCVQDCGVPVMRTCTSLLVILYSGRAQSISTAAPLPESSASTAIDETTDITPTDVTSVIDSSEGSNTTLVPLPDSTDEQSNSPDSDVLTEDTTAPAASVSPTSGDRTTTGTDVSGTMPPDMGTPYVPIVATARSYSSTTDNPGSPEPESTTNGSSPSDKVSLSESYPATTGQSLTSASDLQTTAGIGSSEATFTSTSNPAASVTATEVTNTVTTETSDTTLLDSATSTVTDGSAITTNDITAIPTTTTLSTSSDMTQKNDSTGSVSLGLNTANTGITPESSTASISPGINDTTPSQGETTTEQVVTPSSSQGLSDVSDVTEEPLTSSSTPVAPTFRFNQAIYEASILENFPLNARVPVPIRASLSGSSPGAKDEPVTYRLAIPDPDSAFDVDPTDATLVTIKVIDREQTPQINVTIMAMTPSGLTSTADVIVDVVDVNDNAPRFDAASYIVNVTSDFEEGASIATLEATDADEGENGEVAYFLSGDNSALFSLDPTTGVLTLAARLPSQAQDYSLNLTVTAVDSGLPLQRASVPLIVEVSPLTLKFTVPEPSFFVQAGLPAGTQVGTVRARDEKTGSSNAVTYFLVTSQSGVMFPFTLNPQTGALLTSAPLPPRQQYELTVEARVDDDPPRSVVTRVTVFVESPQ